MKIIQDDIFTKLIPTELDFLCSIADKQRYDREVEEESKKPESERKEIQEIYKFKEAFIPSNRTLESCETEFMEIN